MAEEKKEEIEVKVEEEGGKGGFLADSLLGHLFGGRPWILFILIGFVALLLVLVIAVRVSSRRGGSSQASLVTPGVLTAAVVYGGDRFAGHDAGGALTGIEPELAQELAETEGLELKLLEAATTAEALTLLDTGAADVAFGRITADTNLNGYITSEAYGRCGLFLVTALHDYTDSLALMTGYSVGVMDTVKETASGIDGYEFVSPRSYADAITMGEDVRDRAVNLGVCTERDAIALVKAFPNALQTQEVANGPQERYVAVFPRRSAAHGSLFNAVINSQE